MYSFKLNPQLNLRITGLKSPISSLPKDGGWSESKVYFPHRYLWTCPSAQGEGERGRSQQVIIISTRAMTPFQSIPSLSTVSPTHVTTTFLHQAKVILFPPNLKSPRTQHRTGFDSRRSHYLCNVFLPRPTHIKNHWWPWEVEHGKADLPLNWGISPLRLKDKRRLTGETGTNIFCPSLSWEPSLPLLVAKPSSVFV